MTAFSSSFPIRHFLSHRKIRFTTKVIVFRSSVIKIQPNYAIKLQQHARHSRHFVIARAVRTASARVAKATIPLLSTHCFLHFSLSQLPTLITENERPKSKIRNDSLLSLTLFYHPAKFHRVSTPYGSSVWGELFLLFRPEQFPLFRLYYWRENPSSFLVVSGESNFDGEQWKLKLPSYF